MFKHYSLWIKSKDDVIKALEMAEHVDLSGSNKREVVKIMIDFVAKAIKSYISL